MARVKLSAVVDEIRGQLNGSVFRVQNGVQVLQNKRYRGPKGFVEMSSGVRNPLEPYGQINRILPHAVSVVAREGFPYDYSIDDVRELLTLWAWDDLPYKLTQRQSLQLFTAIGMYFGVDPQQQWAYNGPVVTAEDIVMEPLDVGGGLGIVFFYDFMASYTRLMVSMALMRQGMNYTGRGRMAYRLEAEIVSPELAYVVVPPESYQALSRGSNGLSLSVQGINQSVGSGISPATKWRTLEIPYFELE